MEKGKCLNRLKQEIRRRNYSESGGANARVISVKEQKLLLIALILGRELFMCFGLDGIGSKII
jgi:hypothetical protein